MPLQNNFRFDTNFQSSITNTGKPSNSLHVQQEERKKKRVKLTHDSEVNSWILVLIHNVL
jgi:hypothetical protein